MIIHGLLFLFDEVWLDIRDVGDDMLVDLLFASLPQKRADYWLFVAGVCSTYLVAVYVLNNVLQMFMACSAAPAQHFYPEFFVQLNHQVAPVSYVISLERSGAIQVQVVERRRVCLIADEAGED